MTALGACGDIVRRGDPVRFRNALFAERAARERLFALYAFNLELARIGPMVSEPMIGEIRLQWWRESLDMAFGDGPPRRHEVAEPLSATIRDCALPRGPFDAMIDARAQDLDPAFPQDESVLWTYLDATGGHLAMLACRILTGVSEPGGDRIAASVGSGIAAARYLCAIPELHASARKALPAARIDWSALRDGDSDSQLSESVSRLAATALERLDAPSSELAAGVAPALLERADARYRLSALRRHSGSLADFARAEPSPFRQSFGRLWRGISRRW